MSLRQIHKDIRLKAKLREEWVLIPQEQLRAACEAFASRLRAVIRNHGGHIEKILYHSNCVSFSSAYNT